MNTDTSIYPIFDFILLGEQSNKHEINRNLSVIMS